MIDLFTHRDGLQECRSCELYPGCYAYAAYAVEMGTHLDRHIALDAGRFLTGPALPSGKITEGDHGPESA